MKCRTYNSSRIPNIGPIFTTIHPDIALVVYDINNCATPSKAVCHGQSPATMPFG
jgi:hypothetical protein